LEGEPVGVGWGEAEGEAGRIWLNYIVRIYEKVIMKPI
jgi:hypothetical protein